eukprot:13983743-Alexandrium_andersonii.AAC.1
MLRHAGQLNRLFCGTAWIAGSFTPRAFGCSEGQNICSPEGAKAIAMEDLPGRNASHRQTAQSSG